MLAGDTTSPRRGAPSFTAIAASPGMTQTAIIVWFRTPHPNMPNLIIPEADQRNLAAYIVTWRRGGTERPAASGRPGIRRRPWVTALAVCGLWRLVSVGRRTYLRAAGPLKRPNHGGTLMRGITRRSAFGLVALIAATGAAGIAEAQDAVDIAAAKKEGKVVWYTSTPVQQAQKIAGLFEAQYGIKVELFRSGGSEVLRRFQQELDAKRVVADLMTTSDPAASALLAKRGVFVPFKPVGFNKIPDAAKDKDGHYIAQRLNIMTIYMRGDKVADGDRPKTWADVTDPKYKGKLVMTDPSYTALQLTVVGMLSKTLGSGYYEKLQKTDVLIVRGNQQISDNIKRGERLIAVGALDSYAAEDRAAGHNIVTVYPSDGTFIIPSPTAVIKGSPNPNAAKLLAQFITWRRRQKIFPADGGYAARSDLAPPAGSPPVASIKVLPVDYDYLEQASGQIKKKFNEIFQ